MAKVIFWKSAIDPRKKSEFFTDKETLYDILFELKIHDEKLNVKINGKFIDDIPLDTEINDDDVVEIKRVLHGSASDKETAGFIIQIASVIAAPFTGGASLYVLAAGTLISTGLSIRAAYLRRKAAGEEKKGEEDTEANNFSLTAASNQARHLSPIAVPMGDIHFAPDFNGQPYPSFYGGKTEFDPNLGFESSFFPGGANPPEDWTEIMPAGYIANSPYNWPPVDMKIMDGVTLAQIASLTSTQKQHFAPYFETSPGIFESKPIILWSDDPDFNYFTNLASLYIQNTNSSDLPTAINDYKFWFDPSLPYTSRPLWWTGIVVDLNTPPGEGNAFWRSITNIPNRPNSICNDPPWVDPIIDSGQSATLSVRNYMFNEINGGIDPLDRIPNTLAPAVRYRGRGISVFIEPQKRAMTHVFNFGVGDLTISDGIVKKVDVNDIVQAETVDIDKNTWLMPETIKSRYYAGISVDEGADLINDDDFSGPEGLIPVNDNGIYNFIYRKSPPRVSRLEIDIEGNLYDATSSGIEANYTSFEIQTKEKNDTDWSLIPPYIIQHDSLSPVRLTLSFLLPSIGEYEVRIRKIEKDSNNNNTEKVANFQVTAFKWFLSNQLSGTPSFSSVDPTDYIAQDARGLFLVAGTQLGGQTDKYSAQVQSKCWIYDSDLMTWSWDYTRNPAWWFLFYCRGGFKNLTAQGNLTFPWSPTWGWVNGPGHIDNEERIFGAGLSDDKIDIDKIIEWAQFCDDKNLKIDLVLREDDNVNSILEKIANIGRASVTYYSGLTGVVFEQEDQPSSGMFGMADILKDSFSVDYAVSNVPAKIIATYANRDNDFETEEVEADVPFQDQENREVVTVTFDGVTETQQAQREVNLLAAKQYFQKRTYSWKTDQQGLASKRGDIIYLSHDATQFGFSGRITKFITDGTSITSVETTCEFTDTDISHVMIKNPDMESLIYECHVDGCNIIFDEFYPMYLAPEFLDGTNQNPNVATNWPGSMPDDFTFIADIKETPGKRLRVVECRGNNNLEFEFTAVDDDPAMWSYEFGPPTSPESFDDSEIVLKVLNHGYKALGNGIVKIFWELDAGDFVQIINLDNGQPIEANGSFSFSGEEVTLELIPGSKYNLEIVPFVIGQPYKSISKKVVVWA